MIRLSAIGESIYLKRGKAMLDDEVYITDESGKEFLMKIYLTVQLDGKDYAVVYEDGNEDDLYFLQYDEEGNMYIVDDEETSQKIVEVIEAYEEKEEE